MLITSYTSIVYLPISSSAALVIPVFTSQLPLEAIEQYPFTLPFTRVFFTAELLMLETHDVFHESVTVTARTVERLGMDQYRGYY